MDWECSMGVSRLLLDDEVVLALAPVSILMIGVDGEDVAPPGHDCAGKADPEPTLTMTLLRTLPPGDEERSCCCGWGWLDPVGPCPVELTMVMVVIAGGAVLREDAAAVEGEEPYGGGGWAGVSALPDTEEGSAPLPVVTDTTRRGVTMMGARWLLPEQSLVSALGVLATLRSIRPLLDEGKPTKSLPSAAVGRDALAEYDSDEVVMVVVVDAEVEEEAPPVLMQPWSMMWAKAVRSSMPPLEKPPRPRSLGEADAAGLVQLSEAREQQAGIC